MAVKIALAGNPNCGKTTLFNDLTGSDQYVGNWPGVTVEKKDGRLRGSRDVVIQDLPGIYSLSPYSLEEVVARNYLVTESPDVILNIVDGSNLERNLYLTTQLLELGLPMVVAVNMMDVVKKNGDKIDAAKLSKTLGCPVVEISALKGEGTKAAAELAVTEAKKGAKGERPHVFTGSVEHALAHIEESLHGKVEKATSRWAAIKVFERDAKAIETLGVPADILAHVEEHIKDCEKEMDDDAESIITMDDDAESIITTQRYNYIQGIVGTVLKRSPRRASTSLSDKIDKIVTHRILALPIFILSLSAMWWLAVSDNGPGTLLTDWANDQFLGEDGWHLPFTSHECRKDGTYKDMDYEAAQEFYAPHGKNVEAWEAAYVEAYNEANKGKDGFEEMKELGDAKIDEKLAATVTAEVKLDDDEETGEPVEGVVSVGKDGLVKIEKCEHASGECSYCAKVAKWREAYIEAYEAKHGKGSYEKALAEFNDKAEKKWRTDSAAARAAAKKDGKTYIPKTLFEESEFEELDDSLVPAVVAANGKAPGDCACCGHAATWKCDYAMYKASKDVPEVDPSDYGVFVPGITSLLGDAMDRMGVGDTVKSLVVDGAWGGVATVLGFVPVIAIVFLFLAFLEDCGYMARVAFIMDRIFRKFGLSGKSFIPMIVGKGCGVPAVMAARTIESERDRRMTIILSTFIPCGAKTAIIAMFAALFFRDMWYVAPLMDMIGIAIIVLGGIALKKSRFFAGEAAPFVMELPAYHMPTVTGIWRNTWTRVRGYILKAGLIIFPACVFLWFIMHFDFSLSLLGDEEIDKSILATVGGWIAWLFSPLGFGSWQGAAASVSAEIAKEQATATLGLVSANMPGDATAMHVRWLFASFSDFPKLAAMSFMLFNLFVPPCMVAIAVLVGYMLALSVYQLGVLMSGGGFGVWTVVALLLDLWCLWMVFRPARKANDVRR